EFYVPDRLRALTMLSARSDIPLAGDLIGLLGEPELRAEAIRRLAAFTTDSVPASLLNVYSKLSESEKADAIQTLASRPSYALVLLQAVEIGIVPRKDISPFIARQIVSLKNKEVSEKLTKVWGTIRPASQQRAALTKKYKAIL